MCGAFMPDGKKAVNATVAVARDETGRIVQVENEYPMANKECPIAKGAAGSQDSVVSSQHGAGREIRVYCPAADDCFIADCPEEIELLGAAYNLNEADPETDLNSCGNMVIDDPVEYRECKGIIKQ